MVAPPPKKTTSWKEACQAPPTKMSRPSPKSAWFILAILVVQGRCLSSLHNIDGEEEHWRDESNTKRSSILHQNLDLIFSLLFRLWTLVVLQRSRLNTCCLHEVWLRLKFQMFINSNSELMYLWNVVSHLEEERKQGGKEGRRKENKFRSKQEERKQSSSA